MSDRRSHRPDSGALKPNPGETLTFNNAQRQAHSWRVKNFGTDIPLYHQLLGAMEELGELAHAHLKAEQGIRGTAVEHKFKAQDAIGDCIIFLMGYCSLRGWELGQIMDTTIQEVIGRNWVLNPEDGSPPTDHE